MQDRFSKIFQLIEDLNKQLDQVPASIKKKYDQLNIQPGKATQYARELPKQAHAQNPDLKSLIEKNESLASAPSSPSQSNSKPPGHLYRRPRRLI